MFTKPHHHYLMVKTRCFYHRVFSGNSVTPLLIQTAEQKLSLERLLSSLGNKIIPTEAKVRVLSSLKKRPLQRTQHRYCATAEIPACWADWSLQECHSMWVNTAHGWWCLLHELRLANRTEIMTYPFPRD